MSSVLQVEQLGKRFHRTGLATGVSQGLRYLWSAGRAPDGRWAVRDVSFQLEAGRALGLIGRNGSGKTTLLRLLAGIYLPTTGQVVCHGTTAAVLDLTAGVREDLTGKENLETLLYLTGVPVERHGEAIVVAADFSGLGSRLGEPCRSYSSGMLLRLGYAAAMAVQPSLFLLDEVFSVGDRAFAERCRQQLAEYRGQGTSVVLASHDLDLISNVCDQCLWLEDGTVAADGSPGEVISAYRAYLAQGNSVDLEGGADLGTGDSKPSSLQAVSSSVVEVEPTQTVLRGEAVSLELRFDNSRDIGSLVVGFALKRLDGLLLWGSNTLRSGIPSFRHPYPAVITLRLTGGELPAGTYRFDVCLSDDDEKPVQYLVDAHELIVRAGNEPCSEGLFIPAHEFDVTPVEKQGPSRVQ